MIIHLTPGTGPRTRQRALLIAEDCLSYVRMAFENELRWLHIYEIGGRLVASKVFRADQEEKALRWMTRHLLKPDTVVVVFPQIVILPEPSKNGKV